VTAERAGRVEEIAFEEGRAVRAGARLVALERTRERAAVEDARARLEEAEHDLARRRELERSDFSAEARVEDAETERTRARAALAVARENLDAMTIEAPFAGVTGIRRISPGALIEPGAAITELRVTDPLELRFEVPGTAAGDVETGLEVRAESEAHPDRRFRGRVTFVAPEVDEATRTLALEARVEDPDGLLKPGMFVAVRLLVDERRAVTVPEEALVTRGPGTFVYRVDDEDAVRRVPVAVGVRREGWIELREGAAAGDRIVVAGQQGVQDGSTVRVASENGGA
jgi:membrane fusion protein (multidrug efflux system)